MIKPQIFPFASKREFVTVLVVTASVGSRVTVFRQYGNGLAEPVRGAVEEQVTHSEQLFIDYEVPQDYVITYWAVATDGSESPLESDRKKIGPYNFGRDVIFDLADPKRAMTIYVESFKQQAYGISRDIQKVWGRPDPVVISGVREMPAGDLNLITLTLEERTNFLEIINNGSTIAFSPWKNNYGLPGVTYFAVGSVVESRPSPIASESARRWSLEVQQVAAPPSVYRFPAYGKTWRELAERDWSGYLNEQWWEAIA